MQTRTRMFILFLRRKKARTVSLLIKLHSKNMKRKYLLLPVIAFMFSCSGETKQPAETVDVSQEQSQNIEQYTESLEDVIYVSEEEIDTAQNEIDKLLNEI